MRLRAKHQVPAAQLIAQALWALISGRIKVSPARSAYLIGLETYALRATLAQAEERAAHEAWEARAATGTCACCSESAVVAPVPLEPGGPEYLLCWRCAWPAGPSSRRRRVRA